MKAVREVEAGEGNREGLYILSPGIPLYSAQTQALANLTYGHAYV